MQYAIKEASIVFTPGITHSPFSFKTAALDSTAAFVALFILKLFSLRKLDL